MLETTFHGQKTFRLVGGLPSWLETPYFKGTLTNGANVASERQFVRKKLFFLQTAISRELSD